MHEHGLRSDPRTFLRDDTSLIGALTRRAAQWDPDPGDQALLDARIDEIIAGQNPDGTLSDDARHRYQFTAEALAELANLGVDPNLEAVARAVGAILSEQDDQTADKLGIYTIRALCLLGMGDHPRVGAGLQAVIDRRDEWDHAYAGCPWTPIEHLQTLWTGRDALDATGIVADTLAWIADGMNEAGCLTCKDPWGFLRIASLVDRPVAQRIVEKQVPMILRAQRADGGWGDASVVTLRALTAHGLLDELLAAPPLPPDWTITREIPAPEGSLSSLTHDGEHLWVRECESDDALRLSVEDGEVLSRVKLPEGRNADIGWWDGGLGLTQSDPKRLLRVDPKTGDITREVPLEGMDWISGFAQVNGEVWVADGFQGNVLRIDFADPSRRRPYILGGPSPYNLAAAPDGVWHADSWAPGIIKTSFEGRTPHDGRLLEWGEKPFDGRCAGIAHDGADLWALDAGGKRVCVIERRA